MDGRQMPDPQPENDNDLNDEEIIDLTQVVEGGDDNDIINLTDIMEQPDQAADEPDEAVISLVEAIPTQATADRSDDTDDEIIDLTDVTSSPEPDEDVFAASVDEEELPAEAEETVIDLIDVATTLEADMVEPEPEVLTPQPEEALLSEEEGVIDLLDVATADTPEEDALTVPSTDEAGDVIDLWDTVEPEPAVAEHNEFGDLESRAEAMLADTTDSEAEPGVEPFDLDAPEEAAQTAAPDRDFTVLEDDAAITDEGEAPAIFGDEPQAATDIPEALAAVPLVPIAPPEPPVAEPVPLTEAQMEGALERVIEKIYGEKIEQLMIQTIEKTVKREIEKIKGALLENSDGVSG